MPSPLTPLIAELGSTMDRGDLARFRPILGRLHTEGRQRQPDELNEAIGQLRADLGDSAAGRVRRPGPDRRRVRPGSGTTTSCTPCWPIA